MTTTTPTDPLARADRIWKLKQMSDSEPTVYAVSVRDKETGHVETLDIYGTEEAAKLHLQWTREHPQRGFSHFIEKLPVHTLEYARLRWGE